MHATAFHATKRSGSAIEITALYAVASRIPHACATPRLQLRPDRALTGRAHLVALRDIKEGDCLTLNRLGGKTMAFQPVPSRCVTLVQHCAVRLK